MKVLKLLIPVFVLSIHSTFAQKTEFTVEDILRVKSLNSQTLSPNGEWLAGIISDGKARFGTDHFRFRDPSYLNVRKGTPVLINTESGEQLEIFGGTTRIMDLTWSEDGETLYFFEQKDEKLVLGIFDVKKEKINYPKVDNEDLISDIFGITPSPDGKLIIFGMREDGWFDKAMAEYKEATEGPIVVYDGNENFLKWDQIGVTGSEAKLVSLDLKSGKIDELLPASSYSGIQYSEDGQFLRFRETIRNKTSYTRNDGTEYQIGYINFDEPDSVKYIYEKSEKRQNYTWDEKGLTYAWLDSGNVLINSIQNPSEEPLNLTKDKAFEDEEEEKAVKFSITSFNPSGNQLLLSSENAWWTIGVDGENLIKIYELPEKEEREKAPSRNFVKWSEDGDFIYVSYSEKDTWNRGIQRFNISEGEFEDLMTSPDLYSTWRFADDSDRVVYSLSNGDYPANVFSSTLDFDDQNQLTDLNPWVTEKKWTKSELITYRDVDGKELNGILYYPVDYDPEKTYPLVLEVYETFFNNGYRSSMNLIANQGYFGLRPSVDLEQGYPGEAWMKGVTGAINKLVEEGKVDNDKVGIHGTSYGGYATSLLITQTDRFAAAINISGKVNIISFLGDSPKIGTRNYAAAEVGQDRIGGQFWDEPLKYFQTTAVLYADRIKTPHLLLTGEGDWNVPGTNTRELYYAMRRLGKDVTWVNYMRGGHGAGWASVESDYYDQWERMLSFYEKYFFPEEEEETEEE